MTLEEVNQFESIKEQKYQEYLTANSNYDNAWILWKYEKYIGQYVRCKIYADSCYDKQHYIYIKSITQSTRATRNIVIRGICFTYDVRYSSYNNKYKDMLFSFNDAFYKDIDFEDVKFEIISKEEWEKQYKKYIRILNKHVKEELDFTYQKNVLITNEEKG